MNQTTSYHDLMLLLRHLTHMINQALLVQDGWHKEIRRVLRQILDVKKLILSVHDYIIKATSLKQITYLCLGDLSVAFDTIDHYST